MWRALKSGLRHSLQTPKRRRFRVPILIDPGPWPQATRRPLVPELGVRSPECSIFSTPAAKLSYTPLVQNPANELVIQELPDKELAAELYENAWSTSYYEPSSPDSARSAPISRIRGKAHIVNPRSPTHYSLRSFVDNTGMSATIGSSGVHGLGLNTLNLEELQRENSHRSSQSTLADSAFNSPELILVQRPSIQQQDTCPEDSSFVSSEHVPLARLSIIQEEEDGGPPSMCGSPSSVDGPDDVSTPGEEYCDKSQALIISPSASTSPASLSAFQEIRASIVDASTKAYDMECLAIPVKSLENPAFQGWRDQRPHSMPLMEADEARGAKFHNHNKKYIVCDCQRTRFNPSYPCLLSNTETSDPRHLTHMQDAVAEHGTQAIQEHLLSSLERQDSASNTSIATSNLPAPCHDQSSDMSIDSDTIELPNPAKPSQRPVLTLSTAGMLGLSRYRAVDPGSYLFISPTSSRSNGSPAC